MGAATWMTCLMLVANAGPAEPYHIKHRHFQIPIGIDPSRRAEIKEVKLYQINADGTNPILYGRADPAEVGFDFRAPADGPYYFKMSVVEKATGKEEPGDVRCILVDTVPPLLRELTAERTGDEMTVHWDLIEQNPDYRSFQLEYRMSDAPEAKWSRALIAAPESRQATFPVAGPAVAVRMSVLDLAKNDSGWVMATIKNGGGATAVAAVGGTGNGDLPPVTASGSGQTTPGPLPAVDNDRPWSPTAGTAGAAGAAGKTAIMATSGSEPAAPRVPRGPLPPAQMVRKRQVAIDYEVTKFGPSGIKSVELYVTRDDGRTWQMCGREDNISVPLPADSRTMPASVKRSLTVELQADGLFGFYLVVRSGADLGKPPPQNGIDVPQMRVEVDTTAPDARLYEPKPHPTRRDCLLLRWVASDNKLGPTPVTLQWAERPDGEWQTIGGGELPNSGEFNWQVPANVPPHVYLRLLVRDMAGNESIAQSEQPILVDLSEPEVKPLQIRVAPR